MNAVLNNPYRILGLLVGATAREQTKQISKLTKYLEAEQDPQDDYFFSSLGHFNRTIEHVNDAASKLNLDSDKMSAALFWFYNGNSITDEPAFDALKEGDLEQVVSIWTKLTTGGEISKRNASAYHNLGTLYLSGILQGTNTNEAILEQGISLKLKFLESDFVKDYKALATDETYKTTKKELQISFLKQLQSEIETSKDVSSNGFLDIINKQEFSAKDDFLKAFIQKPIERIEREIESARNKRKSNKIEAAVAGRVLFSETSRDVNQLKILVGVSDIKYTTIVDKVANEILQCSIDFFNESQEKESSENYLETALQLAKQAQTLASGKLTKDRVKDSLETLSDMKDRELNQAIAVLQSIKTAYEDGCRQIDKQVDDLQYETMLGFPGQPATRIPKWGVSIDWAKVSEMKQSCLAWDKVTSVILESIPSKNIMKIKSSDNESKLNDYKSLVDFVLSKISYTFRHRITYLKYWEVRKAPSSNTSSGTGSNTNSSGSSTSSGCYIATMAYGSYDHPQVRVLRNFRDEILAKSFLGRAFIRTYYFVSPKLVSLLKNHQVVNTILRKSLNQFIKIIQK